VTGAQSGGAYFILEAFVPPGGGPPPHIHQREEECFYLLSGHLTMTLGEEQLKVSAGDFVQIARGTPHTFVNDGDESARMLAIFSPAGMEHWMTEALDRTATPPRHTRRRVCLTLRGGHCVTGEHQRGNCPRPTSCPLLALPANAGSSFGDPAPFPKKPYASAGR
jgi:quercetin dioxygenase-like cupin family protein